MIMIHSRINELRMKMEEHHIDVYIIPTSDYHGSEYIGEFFRFREYMSGFTGTAGKLIVSSNEAVLFTDGRYYIQAEKELKHTGISLMPEDKEGIPNENDYIASIVLKNGCVAFDGGVMNTAEVLRISEALKEKNAETKDIDLTSDIWKDRPKLSVNQAFILEEQYSGQSVNDKLTKVRETMKTLQCDVFILTTLDDIAWLYNIRGRDIPCNPVVLSYAVIKAASAYIYINEGALNDDLVNMFHNNNIHICTYNDIYTDIMNLDDNLTVLLDTKKVNYRIYNSLSRDIKILDKTSPTSILKAVKNQVEIQNMRNAHIKDGVAVTKFMYWLKTKVKNGGITEIGASNYIKELRSRQEGFIENSFDTISAYGANAAMMHYAANSETNAALEPEGILLLDSGGQYYEGTTDITRTIILGSISEQFKRHYTAVVSGMLRLSKAQFLYGCRGMNLDILARGPIWELGMDYRCSTGHGIGYMLNVHEGPNAFRWKKTKYAGCGCILEPGMATTNEPGIYLAGEYGIRIENVLLCREAFANEYGRYLDFETLTLAPIDIDGIDISFMERADVTALNEYHQKVYDEISPYLCEDEKEWLKLYTRPFHVQ